jgi:hypothetical protein
MSAQSTVLVRRHHEEIWSKGDVDAVDEMYAPEFVGHHPGAPDWIGPESVKRIVRLVRDAFPDFKETVEAASCPAAATGWLAAPTARGGSTSDSRSRLLLHQVVDHCCWAGEGVSNKMRQREIGPAV